MAPVNIPRLTADERDRNEEREQARYDRIYAEIEEADREEHDREFGPAIPFRPWRLHERTVDRIRAEDVGL